MKSDLLVVDDERLIRASLKRAFDECGYRTESAASLCEAQAALERTRFDLVILDLKLGDGEGLTVLRRLSTGAPETKVVVITAHASVDAAVEAMKLGAFDFVKKPFELDELLATAKNALRADTLERRLAYHAGRDRSLVDEGMVTCISVAMARLERELAVLSSQRVPMVLVTGESGSGKALVARRLHYGLTRADGPFVELNAAAIPENLFESELFGHERGAFSDARERKVGLVEVADGGTLLLDEIGELAAPSQAKLLAFLESYTFRRVGSTSSRSVDVRVVAATNRDLTAAVKAGRFRADLFYRLSAIELQVPPLRERREDVRPLAQHFTIQYAQRYGKRFSALSDEAATILSTGAWPGNVRELRGVIQRAVLMNDAPVLGIEHLPADLVAAAIDPIPAALAASAARLATLEEIELRYMRSVLDITGGNKLRAAERLGVTRQTLARRLGESE